MKQLNEINIWVDTITPDNLPETCQSDRDGVCFLESGACKQCYPHRVQISRYVLTKEELLKLLGDAFDAGQTYREDYSTYLERGQICASPDKKEYINSLL
jgi:hypothetical protein